MLTVIFTPSPIRLYVTYASCLPQTNSVCCIACMQFCVFKWSLSDDLVFGGGVLQLVCQLESPMLHFILMSILLASMLVRCSTDNVFSVLNLLLVYPP
jgi:hypothetical protein